MELKQELLDSLERITDDPSDERPLHDWVEEHSSSIENLFDRRDYLSLKNRGLIGAWCVLARHGRLGLTRTERRKRMRLLIVLCCIAFLIADVAIPSCFENLLTAMLAVGVVTAQLTVICVWGALVRGTFWIRLPWTLLLLTITWCALAWGIAIAMRRSDIDIDVMLAAAIVLVLGAVTSFVPLKIAAMCFQWQIVQISEGDQNSGRGFKWAIRDIMIGMVPLALSLSICRMMLPDEKVSFMRAFAASGLDNVVPFIAIMVFGIVSLLVKLPCIWIALGEKVEKIKSRIGLWVVYCLVLSLVEISLISLLFNLGVLGGAGGDAGEVSGIIISHQLMGALILAVCFALRGLGYQLERKVSTNRVDVLGKEIASLDFKS